MTDQQPSPGERFAMLPWERLRDKIITVDGKPYASYKSLEGAYRFDHFVLYLDEIAIDPVGTPSALRVRMDQAEARFPPELWSSRTRKMALQDYIARRVLDAIRKVARSARTGRGSFLIDVGGQQQLPRTASRVEEDFVEVRCGVVLPAEGRKATSKAAQALLLEELPQMVDAALIFPNHNPAVAQRHVELAEDVEALRTQLADRGLVAFVADGAVLPREPGTDRPLLSRLVTWQSPPELRVTLAAPHRGEVTGMGIPRGVTAIIGTGFSGRSTLLRAIAACVYTHLPGDGREYCVTAGDAVMVRTDEGRHVEGVNLTPFITSLPTGEDPARYRTDRAAAIPSQTAAIAEALEAGTSLVLFDEDTSAPRLLAGDMLWRRVVPEARDPITPLADLARPLYEEHGVSTVAVTSAGDLVAAADTVLAMDRFRPLVVTAQVRQSTAPAESRSAARGFGGIQHRVPLPESVGPLRGRRLREDAQDARTIALGRDVIDLARVDQLVDPGQARAIGAALLYAAEHNLVDGVRTLREILSALEAEIAGRGLEALSAQEFPRGDWALPRRHEIAAAFNRLRTLRVKS